MKQSFQNLPKVALGLLLAFGVTAAVASSAQPAQADVRISVGIGGGYAPSYHWYNWRDNDGWHRQWAPVGWTPAAYGPPAYIYRPGYEQSVYRHRDDVDRDRDGNRDREHHREQDDRHDRY